MLRSFLFSITLLSSGLLSAQVSADTCGKTLPFQLSFFPPLSTNGLENINSTNLFSVNLVAGYAGGLNGIEMGGFANVLKKDMHGAQMAGFANVTGGKMQGVQMAGFCNVNQKDVRGVQMAGFTNIVSDSVEGSQFAGFANITSGTFTGWQNAGFMNLSNGNFKGLQGSGFANIANDSVVGAQFSGFVNVAGKKMQGAQFAGFANVAGGNIDGTQFAGFINTAGDVKGTQVSGFINVAKKLKGAQIGFINYTDSLESGTPIGFLSIVRKGGYRAFELTSNETFQAGAQFKTGAPLFYNIFLIGAKPADNFYWGWGYGFGTNLKNTGKLRINLDLVAMHVNENALWTDYVNLLNKANLGFSWQIAKKFAVTAGPTFNVNVINKNNQENISDDSTIAPWTISDKMYNNTRVQMWPGFHAAVRF